MARTASAGESPPVGSGGTPPGHRDPEPGKTRLREGWNFAAAPRYGAEDEVFDAGVVDEDDQFDARSTRVAITRTAFRRERRADP